MSFDHAALGLAHALAQDQGRAVALLVPNEWDFKSSSLVAAVDLSATHRAHSSLVNAIQAAKRRGVATRDCSIYMTMAPTHADKGMFIEQVHGNSYLHYLQGDLFYSRPSHESRHGVPSPVGAPPRYEPAGHAEQAVAFSAPESWWRNARATAEEIVISRNGLSYKLPRPAHPVQWKRLKAILAKTRTLTVETAALTGFVPRFAHRDVIGGRPYGALGAKAWAHFDQIFVCTLHAEVSLIKAWQAAQGALKDPPSGARLYTSLEPCFMCSGQLAAYKDVQDFVIVYVQQDPKFHPRPTFLTDANFGTHSADGLGLVYRSKGAREGWTARLAATHNRIAAAQLAKAQREFDERDEFLRLADLAEPDEQANSYRESAISVLNREKSQLRRFAKAAVMLGNMGGEIAEDGLPVTELRMLMDVWAGAVRLVMTVGGHVPPGDRLTADRIQGYFGSVGKYLDQTQHENKLRVDVDAVYKAKKKKKNKYAEKAAAAAARALEYGLRQG